MTYINSVAKRKQQQEGKLPLRKYFLSSLLLLLVISCPLLAEPFLQQVEKDLFAHAKTMQWPTFRHEIALWLPNKVSNLPDCQQLIIERQNQSKPPFGRVNYLIQCALPRWKIRAHAKVKVYLAVLHAKTDFSANVVISSQNTYYQEVDISRLNQGFIVYKNNNQDESFARAFQQQSSNRRIRAGKVISPHQLKTPLFVTVGQEVIIRASIDNFTATMKGKARQSGKYGDSITVENSSSNKRIRAIVIAPGVVKTLF